MNEKKLSAKEVAQRMIDARIPTEEFDDSFTPEIACMIIGLYKIQLKLLMDDIASLEARLDKTTKYR